MPFVNTRTALVRLQNLLRCSDCHYVADNPCTLGGCEHIFCSKCCEDRLGESCPVCSMPGHAKDAQVNRQLFNLVSLCNRLDNILTIPQSMDSDNDGMCTPRKCIQINKSVSSLQKEDPIKAQIRLENPISVFDLSSSSPSSSPAKIRRKVRKTTPAKRRNSSVCDRLASSFVKKTPPARTVTPKQKKTIVTPAKEKVSVSERTPTPKTGMREDVPVDQATMTQFFDYVEDEEMDDVADDLVIPTVIKDRNRKSTSKEATHSKLDQEHLSTSDGDLMTKKPKRSCVASRTSRAESTVSKTEKKEQTSKAKGNKKILRTRQLQDTQHSISEAGKISKDKRRNSIGVFRNGCSADSPTTRVTKRSRRSLSPGQLSHNGNVSVVGSAKKSSVDKRNAKGETPLQTACIKGVLSKVEELLSAGATPNTRDNAGWTPLHEACHHGFVKIAELLLNHGALINVPGNENSSPLHDAVSQYKLECVKLLVSRGASLTARNINGLTPLDLAVNKEMKEALKTEVVDSSSASEVVDVMDYQVPCLLATALNREQKITLQKCASVLQAKIADTFSPEVTHIVTSCNKDGMCPRTVKYLLGVLTGKWIVNMEWVELCIEYGSKVFEEAFEVPGTSTNPNAMSAAKGRMNRQNQLPGLFDGCQVYFKGEFEFSTPEKSELQEIIKVGGGQILHREPKVNNMDDSLPTVPYHVPADGKLRNCSVFVVHEKNVPSAVSSPRMCSVTVSWLMDCVATFTLVDPPKS